ncbi:MAG: class I SAM-dependent methyltransferase, partial [Acidimicrobiia bacterium]
MRWRQWMSLGRDPRLLLDQAVGGLRLPHKLAHVLVAQDLLAAVRVQFLATACQLGLLVEVRSPASPTTLAARLGISNTSLLAALLDVGVSVGELRREGSGYVLHGPRSLALVDPRMDAMVALFEAALGFHEPVYQELEGRLRGALPGAYLETYSPMIARASRLAETSVSPFVRHLVRQFAPSRMLDAGCGSGIYLREAASASAQLSGIGIDLDEAVVSQCAANLVAWGLDDRFEARRADLAALSGTLAGPYDLVLMFQNIYYFAPEERVAALVALRQQTAPGVLALVTT